MSQSQMDERTNSPPLGPVDEMVVNDNPLNRSNSLRKCNLSRTHTRRGKYTRSKLLQLVRSLTLIQHHAIVQLLLKPGKIPGKSGPIPNMTLSEPFDLRRVLHRLEVGDERSCDIVSPLAECFSNGKAGLVTDLDFLNKTRS